MATTEGRSAEKAVKAAVFAALNVAALTTTLGSSATPPYTVSVHGKVPQTLTYPLVRVDAAGEVSNSAFGRNAKECRVFVQVFDNDPSDLRVLDIQSQVIALMNRAGGYHTLGTTADAVLTAAGYRLTHVNYDGIQPREPGDEGNAVAVWQRTVMFTLRVEEV
ncbi:MAG: hypothetical protein AB7I50_00535 [Vicinamibacterales bacterium]